MIRIFFLFILIIKNGFCTLDDGKITRDLKHFEMDSNSFFNLLPSKRETFFSNKFKTSSQDEYINYNGPDVSRKFIDRGSLCKKLSGNVNCTKAFKERSGDLNQRLSAFLELGTAEMGLNIKKLTSNYPMQRETTSAPWSDYYWAFYNGAVGFRYSDNQFPEYSMDFMQKYNYVMIDNSADLFLANLFSTNADAIVDNLSPAEKYDLLMSDKSWTLTNKMWNTSKGYLVNGEVETWMGLCHGWAPASYKMARPAKSIIVKASDGKTKIKFYPTDIKALATLLWAEASFDNQFIGERCNVSSPSMDSNGRITNRTCFDVNPAIWHLVTLQKIGKEGANFVIDTAYDRQVWNQPVVAYSYTYFNPSTKAPGKLEASVVAKESFINDKFKKYRAATASYVVGVAMELTYVVESSPNTNETDTRENDQRRSVTYYYDLELDSEFNIVGGEWYQNAHPDFIWTPAQNAVAVSSDALENMANGNWNMGNPIPASWAQAGKKSSLYSMPLAKIINALIKFTKN